jgi:hypothetical protein
MYHRSYEAGNGLHHEPVFGLMLYRREYINSNAYSSIDDYFGYRVSIQVKLNSEVGQ